MVTIFKVVTYMKNPNKKLEDLRSDYDDTMGYFNGVKENPNCESIEVTKLQDSENSSLLECVEIVASYSSDSNLEEKLDTESETKGE